MNETETALTLQAPERVPSHGPLVLSVRAYADAHTRHAVGDRLESALTVALIRRDRPGVFFPEAPHHPEPNAPTVSLRKPVPGGSPAPGPGATFERAFDLLAEGARHDGSADYYAIAAFGTARTELRPMRVEHPARRLPDAETWARVRRLPDAERSALPDVPVARGLVAHVGRARRGWQLLGAVRAPQAVGTSEDGGVIPECFVNVLALRHAADGGAEAGSFWVEAERDGDDVVARFAIPLERVAPYARRGRYDLYVTCGDLVAPAFRVSL